MDRHALGLGPPLDVVHVTVADQPQGRRRGERKASLEQETGDLTRGLQPRHMALEEDAIHRTQVNLV